MPYWSFFREKTIIFERKNSEKDLSIRFFVLVLYASCVEIIQPGDAAGILVGAARSRHLACGIAVADDAVVNARDAACDTIACRIVGVARCDGGIRNAIFYRSVNSQSLKLY
jgi:hypothetical protein